MSLAVPAGHVFELRRRAVDESVARGKNVSLAEVMRDVIAKAVASGKGSK